MSAETYPLSNPPTTPLDVPPTHWNGRDQRAIDAWVAEHRERLAPEQQQSQGDDRQHPGQVV